ncbi:DUF2501 domain-containing protein [Chimaeribacter arupi]|uniref:DUF2501 domain-containing protein n=2 Tax=Yersiniaceae TaxID=1903411 RepID=A0A2N5ESN4_9GAMM|nr:MULTISPECIES: DUF2501 domain-containing protein [Yersiniaceae]MBS0970182.1 DUF2501 domain-containing protein [Nissabacter archeti]MDV5139009.1 DUF2501 domain-containing protein [Chimaeribacter arupi]PLR32980.1 DUF2501 domain-containing protein [Chimaeribacter arupi]PLR44803.1 DUF2501 domain-containing protein [Chimaeribacter arupi]PLR49443.1 DUF2501 domain-containing protein [Chimaeribacter arupi]
MGKFSSRWLVALALGGTLLSGAAQADWAGTLKSASDALNSNNSNTAAGGSNTAATGSGGLSLGTLTGLLNGGDNGLKAESATNAAGVLEYCVKNNVLSTTNAASVKDQLLSKLGIQSASGAQSEDYQDGLGGILHTGQGNDLNLSNIGVGTAQLKQKLKTKACDVVLKQSKKLL